MPQSERSKALAHVLFQQGWALERAGRAAEAAEQYARALKQDRDCVDALIQLGRLRAREGKTDEALALLKRAAKANPRVPAAHSALGRLLFELGRFDQALPSFQQAAALNRLDAEALICRGDCLSQLGRGEEAVASYDAAIALKPGVPQAHTNRAFALHRLGRLDDALAGYSQALALQPNAPANHYNCASVLHALGRLKEAAAGYDAAIALDPAYAPAHFGRGAALLALEDCEGAVQSYTRSASLRPGHAEAWAHLGQALSVLGRSADAAAAAERALALDGASADAWYVRACLKPFAPGDQDLERMEAALAQAEARNARPEDRLSLGFALGKAWMEAGDAEKAFGHLERANTRQRSLIEFDIDAHLAALDAMARSIDAGTLRRLGGAGYPSDRPVFIVGMPRSGTTLIEQILASHPAVHGAGELPLIGELAGRLPKPGDGLAEALTPETLAALGAEYVARIDALAQGALRVTDKMPGNFLYAGLIRLILPKARIIHCVRDPLDTCLSCYETKFRNGALFTYDLRELGLAYRGYERLMAHWREVLPADGFIEVSYEAVIADLEGEARRLLQFCGLDWNAACLDFHRTSREVWTASANQVRRPLYRSSVGRAGAHAEHLRPLIDALGAEDQGSRLDPALEGLSP
jgi:tetratricopeptide (TPR) repeat protein